MPSGHHPRGTIEHRPEVITLAQLSFTGRQPHPHRQLQCPLRGYSSVDCGPRRGKRGAHSITGVFEQVTALRLDRVTQHVVVCGQRHPHLIGVGLPPTGRTLHIGEQKRHNPRRRAPYGHPHRMSHQAHYHPANRD